MQLFAKAWTPQAIALEKEIERAVAQSEADARYLQKVRADEAARRRAEDRAVAALLNGKE